MSARAFVAATLVPGAGAGAPLAARRTAELLGRARSRLGAIIDRRHPQHGANVADRMLMMPAGRGSSGGSAILAEALRLGKGPAGILMLERDAIVVVGALVAAELYGRGCPVALANEHDWMTLAAAARLAIEAGPSGAAISAEP